MAGEGCPICETENMGTWMLTCLNPVATVRSCEEHIVFNLITLLAIKLDMPGSVLYEIIQTGITPEPEEPVAAPEPEPKVLPKRVSTRKRAAKQPEEVPADVVSD